MGDGMGSEGKELVILEDNAALSCARAAKWNLE
jgi:hypothetical protein